MRPSIRIRKVQGELFQKLGTYGQTWVPKHERFIGAPPFNSQQALSSWCWQIASQCGISVKNVLDAWDVVGPSYSMDSGVVVPNWRKVSITTGTSLKMLESFQACHPILLASPEYACLTTRMDDQEPVYRYCNLCLASDAIPYIRKSWRYLFSYICPKHGCALREVCPSCGKRINLSRVPGFNKCIPKKLRTLRICGRCEADLCAAEPIKVPKKLAMYLFLIQEEMQTLVSASQPNFLPGYGFDIDDAMPMFEFMIGGFSDRNFQLPLFDDVKNVEALWESRLRIAAIPTLATLKRDLSAKLAMRKIANDVSGTNGQFVGVDGYKALHEYVQLTKKLVEWCEIQYGGLYWNEA